MPEEFDLSAEAAIEQARKTLELHEGEERDQLRGIDSDTAFDLGYASALFDIDRYREPDPFTADLVEFDIPTDDENTEEEDG